MKSRLDFYHKQRRSNQHSPKDIRTHCSLTRYLSSSIATKGAWDHVACGLN